MVLTGTIVFLLFSRLKKSRYVFWKFEAIGLKVLAVIGVTFAYWLFGFNVAVRVA